MLKRSAVPLFLGAITLASFAAAQGPATPNPTGPLSGATTPTVGPITTAKPPTPTTTAAPPVATTPPATTIAPKPANGTAPAPINAAGQPASAPAATEDKVATAPASVHSLARCLALADANSAQIKMSMDRLAQAHAQLDEIKWIPWSQFSVSGGVLTVPEIRGTSVYSPNGDISISSKLGPAWRVTIEGVVPIWTFGKISSANDAAKGLVGVAAADVDRMKNLVHHDVRRAYFGLMLAHDARYLLNLAKNRLAEAVAHADDNPDADEADVLRMKTYQAEVAARIGEVEKGERMALAGLRFLTGVEAPQPFDVPDEPIAPPKKPLVDVLVYLKSTKLNRPELKAVKSGLEARTAQVEFAKARLYPDIGLGLAFGYANSPIITDQTNPYVIDNTNFLRYGFGIVFKWNLDLLPGAARIRYAEAQLAEVRDTEKFALGGVGVEVENAYATAKDATIREKFYGEAEQLSKRWLATVSAGITVGTKEDRDLVDPLRSYLTNRYNHLQAIMDLDVAFSSLSLATGDESFAEY